MAASRAAARASAAAARDSGLRELLQAAAAGGGEKMASRHLARGRLLPRDRLLKLIDPGSPLLELSPLAAHGKYGGSYPAAGVLTGLARVCGLPALVVANDPTVKAGTYVSETIGKHVRAMELAARAGLPALFLVDSGGGNLTGKADGGFNDRYGFGRIFYDQAVMSAGASTQLSLVLGACTAGGAYVPAMSDEAVMVSGQGFIFLGGPPLVKAATGEIVSAEELGGAAMHSSVSGVADAAVEEEEQGIVMLRRSMATLSRQLHAQQSALADREGADVLRWRAADPWSTGSAAAAAAAAAGEEAKQAAATGSSVEEALAQLMPLSLEETFPVHSLLPLLFDDGSLSAFKADYGQSVLTCFARLAGQPVGVIASAGELTAAAAMKAAHFAQLCQQRQASLITMQHVQQASEGSAAHGSSSSSSSSAADDDVMRLRAHAKLLSALATATVPKLSVLMGRGWGEGAMPLSPSAIGSHLSFLWPTAQAREGDTGPLDSTARLDDDGILLPPQTRDTLALALQALLSARDYRALASEHARDTVSRASGQLSSSMFRM
eukprot:PLAT2236.1.p1 GENE.PLAT2236.1~~PLAT2236.1.p1  ORF type:complete len:552 (-),score=235.27 PLAT2236.1:167-1822(-)